MAVLMTLALTLASSGTFHLRLATQQSNAEQARNLAESTLTLAVDQLQDQPDFGAGGTVASVQAQFRGMGPVGNLTFHAPEASRLSIPLSINNLEGDTTVNLTDGRVLPPFSAYLVAVAQVNGVTKRVESILRIPVYRYAIATSGTLESNGGLFVASVEQFTDLSNGLAAVAPEKLLPGHVVGNGTQPMLLESSASNSTTVTGDAIAGGAVTLGQFTTVDGSVRQNSSPETLPELDPRDYDPANFAGLTTIQQSQIRNTVNPLNPVSLEGPWRRSGDLEVLNGLELNGGYLYVDGDLTITNGLSGKGSIFCTGDINLRGGSGFSTDNIQALVAQGDVNIQGGGTTPDVSFFTGVLYNRSKMALSDVTVVGSAVNNSPTQGGVQLDRVNLISSPEAINFEWDFGGEPVVTLTAAQQGLYTIGLPGQSARDSELSSFFNVQRDAFDIPMSNDIRLALYGAVQDDPIAPPAELASCDNARDMATIMLALRDPVGDPIRIRYPPGGQQFFTSRQIVRPTLQDWIDYLEPLFTEYQEVTRNRIINSDILYQRTKQESLKKGKFSLDPNQFIQFEDKIRVVWMDETSD